MYPSEEAQKVAISLWSKVLKDFDESIINKALDECPRRFTWIPEIAEFFQLCMSFRGSERLQWSEEVMKKVNNDRPSNRSVTAEINLGAEITKKIKHLYPDKHWFRDIPVMFTRTKKYARKIFPEADDLELLQEIRKFSEEDFRDVLEGQMQ